MNKFVNVGEMSRLHLLFNMKIYISHLRNLKETEKFAFLRAFAKLQMWLNVTLCNSTSVHPSPFFLFVLPFAHPMEPGNRYTDLRDILHWGVFVIKYVQKVNICLKSAKNNKQFIWRTEYIYDYLVASVSDL
jgi:hypothetical protein